MAGLCLTSGRRRSPTSSTSAESSLVRTGRLCIVRTCLDTLQIVTVTREILDAAERRSGDRFRRQPSDRVRIVAGLEAIVTRDPHGFAASPVPAVTPSELLERLARPAESE